ncbi:MAG: iron-containing redox enzyme family protein [Actinobacteria bacterium]|nr:iron-containing redox enzyme family protein [Actinomycetota bacterium]
MSARLHRKIELAMPPLVAASKRFVSHPSIRDAYPEFLIAVHGIIRGSVPFMRSALERARGMSPDPVADGLATYLERHIEEELGHDEWVLDDLGVLGLDPALVIARVPSPAVACMVGSQYYWALHYHPVAVLGYMAVLEGYPNRPELIERLRTRTGLPAAAFRTLEEHAELDPGHGEELDHLIDSLPLSRDQEEAVGLSAMSSVELMARCIDEVCDSVETAFVCR